MISVLLILLKILGIILLSLIGIIIVLLLLVLFVPIRYRFKGYYKDEFVCHGKVTWLLHLVSISINFEKELITSIKIFGIPLSVFQKKKKAAEGKTDSNVLPSTAQNTSQGNEDTAISDTQLPDTSQEILIEQKNEQNAAEETTEDSGNNDKQKKLSLLDKIKYSIRKFVQKIREFYKKFLSFIQNIKTKKNTVQHYVEVIRREEVKKAFSLCKKRIFKLIKHILPKKMKVSANFGFEDPSTTGYILAIYGMLPESIGKKIILHPDFERSIIECDFIVKGAVNAWSMLYQLLCILADKNCRALYHIVKKEILDERK